MRKLIIAGVVAAVACLTWDRVDLDNFKNRPTPKSEDLNKTEAVDVSETQGTPIEVNPYITCPECSIPEQMALKSFQDRGIRDRYALAALMGNVKQESKFTANICEGGARVNYENCHTGGYGLIQWTTVGRYDGLGRYAQDNKCNPSTTECQLGYLFTETEWERVEPYLKEGGKSIEHYMQHCYKWLGWGVHGARTDYAYDYTRMFDPHPGTS